MPSKFQTFPGSENNYCIPSLHFCPGTVIMEVKMCQQQVNYNYFDLRQ